MRVLGFTSITFSFSICPVQIEPKNFFSSFHVVKPNCLASSSTAQNPKLWRVCSYSFPMFPSPTISCIGGSLTIWF